MRDQFSNTQQIRKPATTSKGGIVAAQSRKAAEVGAEVLAAGGDCVDAVIATTFALGVLEPWMSGLGGGGAMVLYRAREDRYEVIDYGMRAPGSLRVEDYPLSGGAAPTSSRGRGSRMTATFMVPARSRCPAWSRAWRKRTAATPKCRGRNCWRRASRSPVKALLVDWWTTLMIASAAADLRRYPASATAYLQDGLPPNAPYGNQVRSADAAGQAQGHDGPSRGAGPARLLRRRSGAQPRRRCAIGRRRAVGRRPDAVQGRSARAAGDFLSRRQGVRDAGTDRRTDAGAHAAPVAAKPAAGAQRSGCGGLRGLCARRCRRLTANA